MKEKSTIRDYWIGLLSVGAYDVFYKKLTTILNGRKMRKDAAFIFVVVQSKIQFKLYTEVQMFSQQYESISFVKT